MQTAAGLPAVIEGPGAYPRLVQGFCRATTPQGQDVEAHLNRSGVAFSAELEGVSVTDGGARFRLGEAQRITLLQAPPEQLDLPALLRTNAVDAKELLARLDEAIASQQQQAQAAEEAAAAEAGEVEDRREAFYDGLELLGVRPGMTRVEAERALRAAFGDDAMLRDFTRQGSWGIGRLVPKKAYHATQFDAPVYDAPVLPGFVALRPQPQPVEGAAVLFDGAGDRVLGIKQFFIYDRDPAQQQLVTRFRERFAEPGGRYLERPRGIGPPAGLAVVADPTSDFCLVRGDEYPSGEPELQVSPQHWAAVPAPVEPGSGRFRFYESAAERIDAPLVADCGRTLELRFGPQRFDLFLYGDALRQAVFGAAGTAAPEPLPF